LVTKCTPEAAIIDTTKRLGCEYKEVLMGWHKSNPGAQQDAGYGKNKERIYAAREVVATNYGAPVGVWKPGTFLIQRQKKGGGIQEEQRVLFK